MRIEDLRRKEVISGCSCKILGFVDDVVFDTNTGCISALVVNQPGKLCGLFNSEYEYIVPFDCVTKIGRDVILVKVNEDEIRQKIKSS